MDILAHALWAGGISKLFNLKKVTKEKISVKWAAFWGVFPDLFAFTISFVILFYNLIFKHISLSDFPRPDAIEPVNGVSSMFGTSYMLYNYSHSILIFILVFIIVYFIFKRPVYSLFGWLFHIVVDIPTHSYAFFPTPFLWPLSSWKFDGISWATPWFMVLNYSLLVIIYIIIFVLAKKAKKSMQAQNLNT